MIRVYFAETGRISIVRMLSFGRDGETRVDVRVMLAVRKKMLFLILILNVIPISRRFYLGKIFV